MYYNPAVPLFWGGSNGSNTCLKVQSCKLYNSKYMIASTEKINTDIFAFITVLAFKLLCGKVLFVNRKDNRNGAKVG